MAQHHKEVRIPSIGSKFVHSLPLLTGECTIGYLFSPAAPAPGQFSPAAPAPWRRRSTPLCSDPAYPCSIPRRTAPLWPHALMFLTALLRSSPARRRSAPLYFSRAPSFHTALLWPRAPPFRTAPLRSGPTHRRFSTYRSALAPRAAVPHRSALATRRHCAPHR